MPRSSISIPPLLLFLACQQDTHPDYCGTMKTNWTHEHLTEREHCISSGTARMSCFANLSANRYTHKHQSPSVYLDYLLYTDCCYINCCNPISLRGIKLCPCFPKSLSDTVYPVALTPITQCCCCPGFTLWTPMGGFALQLGYILSMLAGKAGGQLTAETWMSNGLCVTVCCLRRLYLLTGVFPTALKACGVVSSLVGVNLSQCEKHFDSVDAKTDDPAVCKWHSDWHAC